MRRAHPQGVERQCRVVKRHEQGIHSVSFIHDEAQGGCSTRVKVPSMDLCETCTSASICTPTVVASGDTYMFREGLERTTKELAASAPSTMKIKVVAPPDLDAITLPLREGVVPATRRLIYTCTPAPHFSFTKLAAWPRVGCARWRVTLLTALKMW